MPPWQQNWSSLQAASIGLRQTVCSWDLVFSDSSLAGFPSVHFTSDSLPAKLKETFLLVLYLLFLPHFLPWLSVIALFLPCLLHRLLWLDESVLNLSISFCRQHQWVHLPYLLLVTFSHWSPPQNWTERFRFCILYVACPPQTAPLPTLSHNLSYPYPLFPWSYPALPHWEFKGSIFQIKNSIPQVWWLKCKREFSFYTAFTPSI